MVTSAHNESVGVIQVLDSDDDAVEPCEASIHKDTSLSSPRWASGIHACIVPLGAASAARRAIWIQQISANGGTATTKLDVPGISHIVVSAEVGKERFEAWITTQGWQAPQIAARITTAWLVESISRCARADESRHLWPVQKSSHESRPMSQVPSASACQDEAPEAKTRKLHRKSERVIPRQVEVNVAVDNNVQPRSSSSAGSKLDHKVAVDIVPDCAFGGVMTKGQEQLLKKRTKFACQRSGGGAFQHNPELTAVLSQLMEHYEKLGDEWRQRSYRNAMNVLRRLPFKINHPADLDKPELRMLGKKTRDKIVEYLNTGRIRRAQCLVADPRTHVLTELQDIWGVGLTTARLWLKKGVRTVSDVRSRVSELGLNSDQVVGLRYFEEFRQRMPRSEATEIITVVQRVVGRLFGARLRMEPCGSYRRGAETCGDVDILFSIDTTERNSQGCCSEFDILSRIIKELGSFLTDHLKTGKETGPEEHQRRSAMYFGVCQLGPKHLHRRIDLKVYPPAEWPFALLSFTGSGPFNRSMRLYARRAGFSLSDHDIRPANHARGLGRGARIWTGKPIDTVSFKEERDIFAFLGLTYRIPQEREIDGAWLAETADLAKAVQPTCHRNAHIEPEGDSRVEVVMLASTDHDEDSDIEFFEEAPTANDSDTSLERVACFDR